MIDNRSIAAPAWMFHRQFVKIAIFGSVFFITLILIAQTNGYKSPVSWSQPHSPSSEPPEHVLGHEHPPPGPPEHHRPLEVGDKGATGVTKVTSHGSGSDMFRESFQLIEDYGPQKNLMVQDDVSYYGPWTIENLPDTIVTTQNHTLTFRCLYHADLCPSRYIVMIRGPTIQTVDTHAYKVDPEDKRIVTVDLKIPDAGSYKLYAWPDFEQCPHWWRDNMKYQFNRAQVQGTPLTLRVAGPPGETESFDECNLNNANQLTHGRWVNRAALLPKFEQESWVSHYPSERDWIWAPHNCKRRYRPWSDLAKTQTVSHIAWLGDSVSRGSFCSQITTHLYNSTFGTMPGDCKFGGKEWYPRPKTFTYDGFGASTHNITLSFRFVYDHFREDFADLKASLPTNPSHVITNVGLWLTFVPTEEYPKNLQAWLDLLFEAWPHATFIFRTTTDVSPMVTCFSDKNMYRITVARQREIAGRLIPAMRERGMRIYLVDAYSITRARHDTAHDGRHWVIEDPSEHGWLRKQRPRIDDAEKAVVDALAEVVMLDDEEAMRTGRERPPALTEEQEQEHSNWVLKQTELKRQAEEEKAKKEAEEEMKKKQEEEKKKQEAVAEAAKQAEEARKKQEEEERKRQEEEARKMVEEAKAEEEAFDTAP